jgi:hypothetical protein
LFLYMYGISLWLNSTTFQNTERFQFSVILNVLSGLICFLFTVAYLYPELWGELITAFEWFYCILFSFQVLMIQSTDVGLDS